ncbi:MAG: hypothetical protein ACREDW_09785 [Aestuariivirgaceae bacterium]
MMLILKVPAFIAAVLFLSSVSAGAMEFADRPGMMSGSSTPQAIRDRPTDDRLRRQINSLLIPQPVQAAERKPSDRPRPVSLVPIRFSFAKFGDRPGRLSAEFSAVSNISFEHGAGVAGSDFRPIPAPIAMKFENRPGPISNRFGTLAAVSIKFADRRGFTSSLPR